MSSFSIALLAWIAMAASSTAGLVLARAFSGRSGAARARGALPGVVAFLVLLLLLAVAVLISRASDAAETARAQLRGLAAHALEFDMALKQYGATADKGRELLRNDIVFARNAFAGDSVAGADDFNLSYGAASALSAFLSGLKPETDAETRALNAAQAQFQEVAAARLNLALQAQETAPWPLVFTALVASCLAFAGLGALGPARGVTTAALGIGAAATAGALYVALALGHPSSGPFHVAPVALEQAIVELGR